MNQWMVHTIAGHASPARARKWLRLLPGTTEEGLNHRIARENFERYMHTALGHFMLPTEEGPFPPRDLLMRTFVLDEKDAEKKLNPDFYFASGYSHLVWWLKTAEKHGFNLRTARAIMDFGCGTARMIRHLRCIDGIRLVGSDLFPANVEWCRSAIPGVEFHLNTEHPPLEFAADDTFDLVYAASVFTHIPFETQEAWIAELNRVIAPGGFLVCNVLGRYHQEQMLAPEDVDLLHREGRLTVTRDDPRASLATKLIGSWDVFQTRAEVLAVFGRHFQVCDYMPAQIDTLVLRKPC